MRMRAKQNANPVSARSLITKKKIKINENKMVTKTKRSTSFKKKNKQEERICTHIHQTIFCQQIKCLRHRASAIEHAIRPFRLGCFFH